tara:strand:+ start:153 stop:1010 length:858 start_codon:yes stop_codon:yes gene_type:complete
MIIWLASYPKSGNTWVRSFISSLIFTNNGEVDFNAMQKISQYPMRRHFTGLLENLEDLNSLSENWVPSQKLINLDNKIKFFKTHHVMCNFGKNSFTNYENTLGVIQIVRDPRNVITSILNYFNKKNYDEAKQFLFDEKKIIGINLAKRNQEKLKDNNIITLISSWKTHYNSWKNFKKNHLLIKYEDLIKRPNIEFGKIRNYFETKLGLQFSDEKFNDAIEANSFLKLKKIEDSKGFLENVINDSQKKVNFFNLGPENDYKKFLDTQTKKEIELLFFNEMKELKYL